MLHIIYILLLFVVTAYVLYNITNCNIAIAYVLGKIIDSEKGVQCTKVKMCFQFKVLMTDGIDGLFIVIIPTIFSDGLFKTSRTFYKCPLYWLRLQILSCFVYTVSLKYTPAFLLSISGCLKSNALYCCIGNKILITFEKTMNLDKQKHTPITHVHNQIKYMFGRHLLHLQVDLYMLQILMQLSNALC